MMLMMMTRTTKIIAILIKSSIWTKITMIMTMTTTRILTIINNNVKDVESNYNDNDNKQSNCEDINNDDDNENNYDDADNVENT